MLMVPPSLPLPPATCGQVERAADRERDWQPTPALHLGTRAPGRARRSGWILFARRAALALLRPGRGRRGGRLDGGGLHLVLELTNRLLRLVLELARRLLGLGGHLGRLLLHLPGQLRRLLPGLPRHLGRLLLRLQQALARLLAPLRRVEQRHPAADECPDGEGLQRRAGAAPAVLVALGQLFLQSLQPVQELALIELHRVL